MTTKQYLNQIDRFEKLIDNKSAEINRLRQLVTSISITTTGDKVQMSGSKDKLGDSVAEIVDLENEVKERIREYTELRQKIISMIEGMSDVSHYEVLFNRYVKKDSFEQISQEMGYSQRQILRIHRKALAAFEKNYGNEYLS